MIPRWTNIEDYIRGRSSWKCLELNTNTFCWICNGDVGTKPGSDCDNCEHGRGNDDTSGEETESEMDIEKNLVQDNQGKWHICVTQSAEDATIHKLERMYHLQLRMLETLLDSEDMEFLREKLLKIHFLKEDIRMMVLLLSPFLTKIFSPKQDGRQKRLNA